VVSGDVLEKIAKRHHTTAEAIMAANNLANDNLSIGQKLRIPKKWAAATRAPDAPSSAHPQAKRPRPDSPQCLC